MRSLRFRRMAPSPSGFIQQNRHLETLDLVDFTLSMAAGFGAMLILFGTFTKHWVLAILLIATTYLLLRAFI